MTVSHHVIRGRIVELASNCYGCHVLQKALDCEEDVRLLIVSELLLGDPAQTLVNKHASHVWSKVRPRSERFAWSNFNLWVFFFTDHGVDLDAARPTYLRLVRVLPVCVGALTHITRCAVSTSL